MSKLKRDLPPGVPKYNFDLCVGQIKDQKAKTGRPVKISSIDAKSKCPERIVFAKEAYD